MASMENVLFLFVAAFSLLISSFVILVGAQGIAINYSLLGDNLPPPNEVVGLLNSQNIKLVRLFDPNPTVLTALHNSDNAVGTSFRYITAGNELIPGDLAGYVLRAMQNLDTALTAANLNIPVSTAIAPSVFSISYPPSQDCADKIFKFRFCERLLNGVGAQSIGINYGLLGDNLPPPNQVVGLLNSQNIKLVRLFDPNPTVLAALHNSGIAVVLGTLNNDLQTLANDPAFANTWVQNNVIPHVQAGTSFRYITAGNEVIPGDLASYVLHAMQNLDAALTAANLNIPVSTAIATSVLSISYPPSQGIFSDASSAVMTSILGFLASKKTPLLVNVYPYFAYASQPENVRLDYALFTAPSTVVVDGALGYTNLFDAVVDAMYSALEKAGHPDVNVVVSETGWPSAGDATGATMENAMTYNNNVVAHVTSNTGTPKRPGNVMETYIFAMFNEDLKPAGVEQNFGLYYPNMTKVYQVNCCEHQTDCFAELRSSQEDDLFVPKNGVWGYSWNQTKESVFFAN
ncbi:putative glucan endo-1,3-beta-glucosidase GVI [Phoenix dactylifera]|uniref:Glucan endo-1,3-beta-glucosidase GVI n=1 Tax=Phoenix dactylifera TaxID=42345 RepID=A0A8B8ZVM0_PHODC|nr:putative glucan endo-1,3-beta-glucosidase GVI [Phoenix dactylifera]